MQYLATQLTPTALPTRGNSVQLLLPQWPRVLQPGDANAMGVLAPLLIVRLCTSPCGGAVQVFARYAGHPYGPLVTRRIYRSPRGLYCPLCNAPRTALYVHPPALGCNKCLQLRPPTARQRRALVSHTRTQRNPLPALRWLAQGGTSDRH